MAVEAVVTLRVTTVICGTSPSDRQVTPSVVHSARQTTVTSPYHRSRRPRTPVSVR